MMRPRGKLPLSLTRTTTLLPLARLVTLTKAPKGNVGGGVGVALVRLPAGGALVVVAIGVIGGEPRLGIASPVARTACIRLAAAGRQQQAQGGQQPFLSRRHALLPRWDRATSIASLASVNRGLLSHISHGKREAQASRLCVHPSAPVR